MVYIFHFIFLTSLLVALYQLVLKKLSNYQANRFFLLIGVLGSLVLPLLKYNLIESIPIFNQVVQLNEVIVTPKTTQNSQFNSFVFFLNIFTVIWLIGVSYQFIKLLFGFFSLFIIYKTSSNISKQNQYIIIKTKYNEPFSFFNLIFVPYKTDQFIKEQYITHEKHHVRQLHSADILFFNLLIIIFWFNPFLYLLKNYLQAQHEFFVDKQMNSKSYQNLIINQVFNSKQLSFVNPFFNQKLTLKRLQKMTTIAPKTNHLLITFHSMMLLLIMLLSSLLINAQENSKSSKKQKDNVVETIKEYEEVLTIDSDKLIKYPKFKELVCETDNPIECFSQQINQFVAKNLKYPEEAVKQNLQGKVFVKFNINKQGFIEVTGIRGPHKSLENETKRLLELMPQFEPAETKEGKVSLIYSLPISFSMI